MWLLDGARKPMHMTTLTGFAMLNDSKTRMRLYIKIICLAYTVLCVLRIYPLVIYNEEGLLFNVNEHLYHLIWCSSN